MATSLGACCGSTSRAMLRRLRLWHFASYVFVINRRDELCVQHRTDDKDVFPGMLDLCAGGVVAAGETCHVGAAREASEELGVSGQLNPVGQFCYPPLNVHGAVYWLRWEREITPQPEEVTHVEWLDIQTVLTREHVTPDSREALMLWLRQESCPLKGRQAL
ncbi:NUDIX hydrolase [Larsenimonas rhizosphaerae]|uniref:NUDIX domain-containing protein n=1 Tax=Larsenimonas rhizosphaerae TaxID=2944682 RepID=A0AA41ZMH1_9GAMM|nr:NUDIX domain-containing protein [Larsenimonas rhizosphaerae]MCM2129917.1 NUDIX domain-containing protein [Larsenimonas rhizosphaerae]MCX2524578.1 NUDIX domain-containing protein [Larsenimonas rhizosphaerae]